MNRVVTLLAYLPCALTLLSAPGAQVALSLPAPRSPTPALAGDLLLLRCDGSLTGAQGEAPTQASGFAFQSGVHQQGVQLGTPNQLLYAAAGNIDSTHGTFSCWLKPTWNGNDGRSHFVLSYGGGGGMLIGKDGANNLRIILNRFGTYPGGEVGVAVNVSTWLAQEWHHIAFTWSDTAKRSKLYVDGSLRAEETFRITLPAVTAATLQIGGDNQGDYCDAVLDNLRIGDAAASAAEIAVHMLEGLSVTSWSLDPPTNRIELWPGWAWWVTPVLRTTTNVGLLSLPMLAAQWSSSDARVAAVDPQDGRVRALAPGSAVLTGTLGGQSSTFTVDVAPPVRAAEEERIDPFLATPASGYLHRIPVVVLRYLPTRDGIHLDPLSTGMNTTLAALKVNVLQLERWHKFMLEEGGRFRGYRVPGAAPALGYQVIRCITVYEEVPPGFPASTQPPSWFPDYNQILARFDARRLVEEEGVKEFWLVHQHAGRIGINESNMSSPTTGDISNSYRTNNDQPVFGSTYVTYGINFGRSQAEATHNHGHQLEAILSHINQRQDGNTTLWWQQFARPISGSGSPPARCGNTHFPPNATRDYDYTSLLLAVSDIMDWQPAGGPTTLVNADTWGTIPYAWPGGTRPPQEIESKWYMFWFQSMPGLRRFSSASGMASRSSGRTSFKAPA